MIYNFLETSFLEHNHGGGKEQLERIINKTGQNRNKKSKTMPKVAKI
jgi:hypothetical protein